MTLTRIYNKNKDEEEGNPAIPTILGLNFVDQNVKGRLGIRMTEDANQPFG